MVGVTAAIIGSAVIGGVGSAIAGSKNADAIEKSTDAGVLAQQQGIAAQQDAFNKSLALNTDIYNSNAQLQADAFNRSSGLQSQAFNVGFNALNPTVQAGNVARNAFMELLGHEVPKGQQNPIEAPEPITPPQLNGQPLTQQPINGGTL